MRSAATILARKLGLKEDAIVTYRGSVPRRREAIVFALKQTRGVPAPLDKAQVVTAAPRPNVVVRVPRIVVPVRRARAAVRAVVPVPAADRSDAAQFTL